MEIGLPGFSQSICQTLNAKFTCEADNREPGLWLPFRLAIAQGGVIAVTRDNTAFVEPGHPCLIAVDGKPLQVWLDAALKYEPVGSATQNLYASLKGIRRIDILRSDLGIAESASVALTFANTEGKRKDVTLPCRDRFSNFAQIRIGGSRGGSGSSRTVNLPRSGIAFKLSTMASFRPNGAPFEGKGVAVDVPAQPPPKDFITGEDTVLEQATGRSIVS